MVFKDASGELARISHMSQVHRCLRLQIGNARCLAEHCQIMLLADLAIEFIDLSQALTLLRREGASNWDA